MCTVIESRLCWCQGLYLHLYDAYTLGLTNCKVNVQGDEKEYRSL